MPPRPAGRLLRPTAAAAQALLAVVPKTMVLHAGRVPQAHPKAAPRAIRGAAWNCAAVKGAFQRPSGLQTVRPSACPAAHRCTGLATVAPFCPCAALRCAAGHLARLLPPLAPEDVEAVPPLLLPLPPLLLPEPPPEVPEAAPAPGVMAPLVPLPLPLLLLLEPLSELLLPEPLASLPLELEPVLLWLLSVLAWLLPDGEEEEVLL